jgi:glycosyltransferase involved in cell wall biosynthesis
VISRADRDGSLPLVSVIIPCYNEAEGLRETHRRVTEVLSSLEAYRHEVIYVDDGSGDRTPELLRELQAGDPQVRVVYLSRNFGHQFAVSAGLAHASGDAVAIMDADLQDPPQLIPEMLARWREGYEVVYGVRTDREGETRFKLWTARAFYRLIRRLSDTEIPPDTGDFRLMDRRVVDAIVAMPERDRFVRGMVSWVGFRQTGVPYRRAPRFAGSTKYPFVKMARFALDGILSFSMKPLRVSVHLGFLSTALALVAIVYTLAQRLLTGHWVTGWTTLLITVLLFGGIQLISLGIIGEYIGRLYGEAKRRPLYLIRERLGFAEPLAVGQHLEQGRDSRTLQDRRVLGERRRGGREGGRETRKSGAQRSARPA